MKLFYIMNGRAFAVCVLAGIALYTGVSSVWAGVDQSGLGPRAVQSFGLEKPQDRPELRPGKINTRNPLKNLNIPVDALMNVKNGRVQLFSVSRLSESDMRNPFEIRVQVAVEMAETVFEVGGIVEGKSSETNTVILLLTPPQTREPAPEEVENADQKPGEVDKGIPVKKKEKEKKISVVCSVGDIVQGFRIHAINRDGIVVEQTGKYVQVPRGDPVTISVPLTFR